MLNLILNIDLATLILQFDQILFDLFQFRRILSFLFPDSSEIILICLI